MDQTGDYDLTTHPWIGVRQIDGGRFRRVGIEQALRDAHTFHGDLVGHAPTATSALWRVLAVFGYRVTGLDESGASADEWRARRNQVRGAGRFDPTRIRQYLEGPATGRLQLFGPDRPWLQDPRLNPDLPDGRGQCSKWSGLNKLLPGRPSDNSPAVWSPNPATMVESVTALEAIDGLLHTLWFAAPGQMTARTCGNTTSSSGKVAPLRGWVSTHPTGPTLFDSILAHLVYPEGFRHPDAIDDDLAPWETPSLPNCKEGRPWTTGIVGQLTNASHAVLLHRGDDGRVDNACVTVAAIAKQPAAGVALDPYLPWRRRKTEAGEFYRSPLNGDVSRSAWRDLDAILADPASTSEGSAEALSGHEGAVTVIAAAQERGKGTDTGWSLVHLPADLVGADRQSRALVGSAVIASEKAWTSLKQTIASLRKPRGDQAWERELRFTPERAAEAYWPAAENAFLAGLDDLMAARVDPLDLFRPVALQVFDDLASTYDEFEHLPRLLEGRDVLRRRLSTPKEARDASG